MVTEVPPKEDSDQSGSPNLEAAVLKCIVNFSSVVQATAAMKTLQGYRFDKNDEQGLFLSF